MSNTEMPWFEEKNSSISDQSYDKCDPFYKNIEEFSKKGFTVLDLEVEDRIIDSALGKLDELISQDKVSKNPKYYHYNESPRVIEAWKQIDEIAKLANNENVLNFLELTYQKKPLPFSTINFIASTEQPLHSDYWHFGSIPERYLCGVWIAMEDIHEDSGPLQVVPNSFTLPNVNQEKLGLNIPKNLKILKENYSIYEDFIRNQIKELKLKPEPVIIKKGQCLIWSANLLHGAFKRKNKKLSRKSMVTHYHFEGCKFYNPVYTDFSNKVYNERILDIVK